MTIAKKAAMLAAVTTLGWASAASATDFITYRISTSGTGTRTVFTPSGDTVVTALRDLTFDYTLPFTAVADDGYAMPLPGQHGLYFDGSASLTRDGAKLVIDDESLARSPGYAPFGTATGTLCLADAGGTALPTGGVIALASAAGCGGQDLAVSLTTRDLRFTYAGAFTGLSAMFGDGAPTNGYGIALAVPEPSSWALMLVGFAATGYALRRRRAEFATA